MPGAPIAIALPTKTNLYSDRALGEKHSKTQVPPGPAGRLGAESRLPVGGGSDELAGLAFSFPAFEMAEDPR